MGYWSEKHLEMQEAGFPVTKLKADNFSPEGVLSALPNEQAAEIIEDWFLHFFSDPAEEMPYHSREGGYQYIYGGPYDASEQIQYAFDGLATPEQIQLAINNILGASGTWDWAPSPYHPDQVQAAQDYYENYAETEWLRENNPLTILNSALQRIHVALDDISKNSIDPKFLRQMLFVQAFSALESFLFDRLKAMLIENDNALMAFARKDKYLSKISFSAEQVLGGKADVKKAAIGSINSRIFHRLDDVLRDYENACEADFSGGEFQEALDCLKSFLPARHHCVHRNGRDLNGNEVEIEAQDVRNILEAASFVSTQVDYACIPGGEVEF